MAAGRGIAGLLAQHQAAIAAANAAPVGRGAGGPAGPVGRGRGRGAAGGGVGPVGGGPAVPAGAPAGGRGRGRGAVVAPGVGGASINGMPGHHVIPGHFANPLAQQGANALQALFAARNAPPPPVIHGIVPGVGRGALVAGRGAALAALFAGRGGAGGPVGPLGRGRGRGIVGPLGGFVGGVGPGAVPDPALQAELDALDPQAMYDAMIAAGGGVAPGAAGVAGVADPAQAQQIADLQAQLAAMQAQLQAQQAQGPANNGGQPQANPIVLAAWGAAAIAPVAAQETPANQDRLALIAKMRGWTK